MKSLSTGASGSLVNLATLSTRNNLPASGLLLIETGARHSDGTTSCSTDDARTHRPVSAGVERWSSNGVRQLTVGRLLVYEVKLLPCYVDHFCFFDHETSAGARNLFGWLVRDWFYMHYYNLKERVCVCS